MKWKLDLYRGLLGLGVPKIRGTILGVPIIRTVVYWGLYWVPLWETTISGGLFMRDANTWRFKEGDAALTSCQVAAQTRPGSIYGETRQALALHMGASKNQGYLFGVPIIRTIVSWGL